jgi:hypothetical protein
MRWAAVVTALVLATPAQAADIYVGRMDWGIPAIVIKGKIDFGDEGKFAAVAAMRQALVVNMQSPGDNVPAAIAIGRMVREYNSIPTSPAMASVRPPAR